MSQPLGMVQKQNLYTSTRERKANNEDDLLCDEEDVKIVLDR